MFRDRYQDALREMIEARLKGRTVVAKPAAPRAPVVDLTTALKQPCRGRPENSGTKAKSGTTEAKLGRKDAADRRQSNLLLPVTGGGRDPRPTRATEPTSRRRKA